MQVKTKNQHQKSGSLPIAGLVWVAPVPAGDAAKTINISPEKRTQKKVHFRTALHDTPTTAQQRNTDQEKHHVSMYMAQFSCAFSVMAFSRSGSLSCKPENHAVKLSK